MEVIFSAILYSLSQSASCTSYIPAYNMRRTVHSTKHKLHASDMWAETIGSYDILAMASGVSTVARQITCRSHTAKFHSVVSSNVTSNHPINLWN